MDVQGLVRCSAAWFGGEQFLGEFGVAFLDGYAADLTVSERLHLPSSSSCFRAGIDEFPDFDGEAVFFEECEGFSLALAQRFVAEFAFDEFESFQGRIVREVVRHSGGKTVEEREILWRMCQLQECEEFEIRASHDGMGTFLMEFFAQKPSAPEPPTIFLEVTLDL